MGVFLFSFCPDVLIFMAAPRVRNALVLAAGLRLSGSVLIWFLTMLLVLFVLSEITSGDL